jgi:argininosuccinate synthase
VPRAIFAFNGDLESRLALHWLAREQGYEVIALSINLGQEIPLQPLGELALELGAVAAQVIDGREQFLRDFAWPLLQADAVYQTSCFLGSALSRYLVAQELVRLAHEEGCGAVAHSAASLGNDQVRLETAIASQDPALKVLVPVRQWGLRSTEEKLAYARRHRLPVDEPRRPGLTVDRNLWGASLYLHNLTDPWAETPVDVFILTRSPEEAPDQATQLAIGFEAGLPVSLDGQRLGPVPLVRELNRVGGTNGIGRSDVIEDRLLGIKTRELYEAPAPTLLLAAHRDLQSLVQSRELINLREQLSRRYAELVYGGLWFHDLRRSLDSFFRQTQGVVAGEVRLKLFKGCCAVVGRRSPHGLFDSRLAETAEQDWLESEWTRGFPSLWTLPSRLAARQQAGIAPDG